MEFYSQLGNRKIKINLNNPIDISIPITFSKKSLTGWQLNKPKKTPVKIQSWIGSVKNGAGVNFNNIYFNPHAHTTHTECAGHITKNEISINSQLKTFFFFSKLITITPKKKGCDLIIPKSEVVKKLKKKLFFNTLIIRTLPNNIKKKYKDYTDSNPPYFTQDCILYLKDLGVQNLLIDLPSVDKEKDGGAVKNHKAFFNFRNGGNHNTITELIYVPNKIKDGDYFLNLQFMSMENDASPSRPVLFKIDFI